MVIPRLVAAPAILGLKIGSRENCMFPEAVAVPLVALAAWVHLQSAVVGSTLAGALGTAAGGTQAMTEGAAPVAA